jgi:hypothetical protein
MKDKRLYQLSEEQLDAVILPIIEANYKGQG